MNLDWSERIYRVLLLAYPAAFRRAHGREMVQLFRDTYRDAAGQDRVAGRRGFWLALLIDWAQTSFRERVLSTIDSTLINNVQFKSTLKGALIGAVLGLAAGVAERDLLEQLLGGLMGAMSGGGRRRDSGRGEKHRGQAVPPPVVC